MTQPLQHQRPAEPAHIVVIRSSSYFTPGRAYAVLEWRDGVPWIHNDAGTKTWLTDRRWWAPVPEAMTQERSLELLHARWRAERARQEA